MINKEYISVFSVTIFHKIWSKPNSYKSIPWTSRLVSFDQTLNNIPARNRPMNLDEWLTVHGSIILFNFQLDAQNSSLYIIHLLKSSTYFEHYPAHLQNVYVVIVYMQPLVSSLCAGDCPVHRLRKNFFLNRCTGQSPVESDDTRGFIYTITT